MGCLFNFRFNNSDVKDVVMNSRTETRKNKRETLREIIRDAIELYALSDNKIEGIPNTDLTNIKHDLKDALKSAGVVVERC